MKLNTQMRDQFMDAVEKSLPPVPRFDMEAWSKRYKELMELSVPEDVKAVDKKHPGAVMVESNSFHLSGSIRRKTGRHAARMETYVYLYASPIRYGSTCKSPEIDAFKAEAKAAFAPILEAEEERYALLRRLEEIVKSCATDTALRELLPEMAHLIPKPAEKPTAVVATVANNVVAELVKAGLALQEEQGNVD